MPFLKSFTLFSTIKWLMANKTLVAQLIFPNYRIIELSKNKNNNLIIDNKILMFVYSFKLGWLKQELH